MNTAFVPPKEQYQEWLKTNPTKRLSAEDKQRLDDDLRDLIARELNITGELEIDEFMLLHKWYEVQDFVPKQDPDEIERVKNLIWKPKGRSDFRRIEPELVLTSDTLEIKRTNFWNKISYQEYVRDEELIRHWNILRVLISSSRHDGVIGRQLRYLVRDRVTQTYLGIICIGSSMMNLSVRNAAVFGGDITKNKTAKENFARAFGKGGRSVNMANGQTIMCTQPFGRYFNGGKLLALLCTSDQVQKDWYQRYDDVLVSVETTSLYGQKTFTQYDGLRPFWRNLGKTSGDTPIKPTDKVWKEIRRWVKKRYPTTYHHFLKEKNEKGQPAVRDKKNGLITKVYGLLGLKNLKNTLSGHQRGVFLCRLYTNTDDFLQCRINEKELVPAFDNSVERLTEFWKFGYQGDTKGSVHPEISKHFKNKFKFEQQSPAKYRLEKMIKDGEDHIELATDWYAPMSELSFDETKIRFLGQVSR